MLVVCRDRADQNYCGWCIVLPLKILNCLLRIYVPFWLHNNPHKLSHGQWTVTVEYTNIYYMQTDCRQWAVGTSRVIFVFLVLSQYLASAIWVFLCLFVFLNGKVCINEHAYINTQDYSQVANFNSQTTLWFSWFWVHTGGSQIHMSKWVSSRGLQTTARSQLWPMDQL